jgi:hypothetical protein
MGIWKSEIESEESAKIAKGEFAKRPGPFRWEGPKESFSSFWDPGVREARSQETWSPDLRNCKRRNRG